MTFGLVHKSRPAQTGNATNNPSKTTMPTRNQKAIFIRHVLRESLICFDDTSFPYQNDYILCNLRSPKQLGKSDPLPAQKKHG
jgi:hypothetical protein